MIADCLLENVCCVVCCLNVLFNIMMVGSVPHCESLTVCRLFLFLGTDNRAEDKSDYYNPFYDQTLPKLRLCIRKMYFTLFYIKQKTK